MKIVDINVLLYAVNRSLAHHEVVKVWWEESLSEEESIGVPWIVLSGFIRLSTNSRVFSETLSLKQATDRIDAWLSLPNIRLVYETTEHWRIYRQLLQETGVAGNLTTDAHLAALAISHGATLVSCDADFGRFRHLRWENPLSI